jgi:hypothetical protein
MAGLIQNAQQPDPKIVQRIVMAATMALNQQDVEQQMLQAVKTSGDPARGLAQALVMLMKILYEKSKRTMPMRAAVQAALQVLVMIAKSCESAGLLKVSPQLIKQAGANAVQLLKQSQPVAPPAVAQAAPNVAQAGVPMNMPLAPGG